MSFVIRLLSALVLGPLFLTALYVGGSVFKAVMIGIALIALYEFWGIATRHVRKRWKASILVFGLIYTGLAFFTMTDLHDRYGFILPGLIITSVWASDIGGYLFGKLIGGRKLCPSVSPNKTWAGFIGACLFPSVVIAMYLAFFVPDMNGQKLIIQSLSASVFIGFLGQMGDMAISVLKRRADLKDTGNLIPGHGGILDRIDSLMLVIIAIWVLLSFSVITWNTYFML